MGNFGPKMGGPAGGGPMGGGGGGLFRCYRYGPNYPGLAGKQLNPS